VKEKRSPTAGQRENLIASSFRQLTGTFREIRRYRQVLRFLLARLFFNDALITIFAFGGIHAAGTFHFSFTEIMIFGIVLNITAGLGAFVMGFLDDVLGGKRTILLSLWGLALASLLAICAGQKAALWIAGAIIGIFSGPNQSASRSLLGRFIPPDQENEFYGFFAFSGKATAFLGPFFLGLLTDIFHTQRAGLSIVILLFIIGGILLHTVDEEEGKRAAGRIQEKKP
jgi:UMF1 family MFS transporter